MFRLRRASRCLRRLPQCATSHTFNCCNTFGFGRQLENWKTDSSPLLSMALSDSMKLHFAQRANIVSKAKASFPSVYYVDSRAMSNNYIHVYTYILYIYICMYSTCVYNSSYQANTISYDCIRISV